MIHHNALLESHRNGYCCKVSLLPLKIVMCNGDRPFLQFHRLSTVYEKFFGNKLVMNSRNTGRTVSRGYQYIVISKKD
jgi:hypothetical protein